MKKEEIPRNRPADEGERNDPDVRDESAIQPGVNTISSSETDEDNEHLTRTAADDFREREDDAKADPAFDEIDHEDI
jgi:hypothetical protein